MRTIVLADHLGIDQLTRAFGMVALFQGAAFMTNAPLAGKMLFQQPQQNTKTLRKHAHAIYRDFFSVAKIMLKNSSENF